MVQEVLVFKCSKCGRTYSDRQDAIRCESKTCPFKIGDHIALNGDDPEAGMSGFVRQVGEPTPHRFFAVIARTDKWSRGKRLVCSSEWCVFLGGSEKVVPPPEAEPIEPVWSKMPEWIRIMEAS